jgi:hypothetical protein
MNDPFTVRVMEHHEVALAAEWAAAEGWNPGLCDHDHFGTVDPHGFHMGELHGAPASTISVVNYDDGFSFLGFYIVRPELRGRGYGLRTWRAAIARAGSRTVGLDGVVDQQDNYRKSGFVLAHRRRLRPASSTSRTCRSPQSRPTMRRCFRRRGHLSCAPGSTRPGIADMRSSATAGWRAGA